MKAPVEALARAMTRQGTPKLEPPEHTGSSLHDSGRLSKTIMDRRKSEHHIVSETDSMSSSGRTFCESPVLKFKPAEILPPKSQQVKQAECTLRSFVQVVREDSMRRQCARGVNAPPVSAADLIMPQRYFYAQGANELMKLKVVNVGPDTASLQLPAYTLRLIKLVKHRRRRLREIANGYPLFAHENRIILEHETEIFEQALRDALHMLKSTRAIRHNKEALLPPPNDMILALSNRKALRQPALKARLKPFADMNDFIADISVSGVTDMLASEASESTAEIADEVQQLRANVQRVRRDIAHFLNEEEEPPILHIRADRSCSIHSLNSSL
ncbi:hypothetical protein GNI_054310 [Gregarina niphandrodes]|uniref:Uncharacterized protein n=1 Tax=Gregarina niphandrodes TaxID=110365 RepID=A0A023B949_GRENI|nr:hypothetical protein GNI_054310 [Gregarina niphandrodes]EZG70715.1 hypothetical protein GNI_054310 [Gregarina niphandrodes]|eukprot:XP_011129870.1 hypothetical protein GNI_054310 [Gregarina niphandrodes]